MSLIKILPENLVNQIAAGEVVERPASVVKELIENALDAGSTKITIETRDAGKSLIKISDNGCGMDHEDAQLALQRHATSKLLDQNGLWNIRTMGFRGEALASISSVSRLTLKTKKADDLAGTEINCEGGEIKIIKEVGMSTGTQIEVHNLFFNTPAREKYLKRDSTELSHMSSIITNIALANPEVAIKFIHNDNTVFDLPKATDLISRISDVFGKNLSDSLIPIFYSGTNMQIDGFIGKPVIARSSSQNQYFFVNKRPIQHFLLANTIKTAFHSLLMENKKPFFILNIKIDPSLIDVNVHPRKLEIRFEDQEGLIRSMYSSVKSALEKADLMPKAFTQTQRYMTNAQISPAKNHTSGRLFDTSSASISQALEFSKNLMKEREFKPLKDLSDDHGPTLKPLSQVSNSYIVAQNQESIVLIDQHAAHERIRYEQLMDQLEKKDKLIQPLLMPFQIELSASEMPIFNENKAIFDDLGFEIENFGGKTFAINSVPAFLSKEDISAVINGVIDDILEEKLPTKFQGKIEEILTYMACRSAIKFGQHLSMDEMTELLKQLETLKRPYTCPHGRPTMISLTKDELEKMFGRK